jgi:hypothetical protein
MSSTCRRCSGFGGYIARGRVFHVGHHTHIMFIRISQLVLGCAVL